MKKPALHFKTNTLLKNLVGKDLINDDNIAIVELVKNSLDASSNSALVRFKDINSKKACILIADKGTGMSETDIKEKWLNIAYSEKKHSPTENGSFYAGNKGIGRFSCDRLGSKLSLITCKKDQDPIHLTIDWTDFEVEDQIDLTIQEIPVSLSKISHEEIKALTGIKMPMPGTILLINDLRSEWDYEKLQSLKGHLERFLNPNQIFSKNPFKITLSVPDEEESDKEREEHEKINGIIKNKIFKDLEFNATYIESTISKDGNEIKTELFHEGEMVFTLTERNTSYCLLKDIHAVIYFLNPYKKAYFKRQTGIRSIDFGSIFLFLNGFRVAPYGERGDDWLRVDIRRTQGYARFLGSRDIIGRIEIIDSEEKFKPISSREGLKKTPEFIQLREKYFIDVLKKLEKFVVDGLDWDSIPKNIRDFASLEAGLDWKSINEEYSESWDRKKQRIALSIMTLIGSSPERTIKFWFNPSLLENINERKFEEVSEIISEVASYDKNQVDSDLSKNLKRIAKILSKKDQEAREAKQEAISLRVQVGQQAQRIEKLSQEKETYRAETLFVTSAASLDPDNLLAFHHQIALEASIIEGHLSKAIKSVKKLENQGEAISSLEKISYANKKILAVAQFATKANFRSSAKKEPTDIPAFVEQYLKNVASEFVASSLSISIKNSIKEAFEIKASRIELSILIDNIASNSNKSGARKLEVKMSKTSENSIQISFIDDGKGLSDAIEKPDDIFKLGVTTTNGSGIGLYQVKKLIDSLDGTIIAKRANPKGLEIVIGLTR